VQASDALLLSISVWSALQRFLDSHFCSCSVGRLKRRLSEFECMLMLILKAVSFCELLSKILWSQICSGLV